MNACIVGEPLRYFFSHVNGFAFNHRIKYNFVDALPLLKEGRATNATIQMMFHLLIDIVDAKVVITKTFIDAFCRDIPVNNYYNRVSMTNSDDQNFRYCCQYIDRFNKFMHVKTDLTKFASNLYLFNNDHIYKMVPIIPDILQRDLDRIKYTCQEFFDKYPSIYDYKSDIVDGSDFALSLIEKYGKPCVPTENTFYLLPYYNPNFDPNNISPKDISILTGINTHPYKETRE